MATEIRVPVRLEVLQDSISSLQKILNNLQPNTSNFKDIERIIKGMTNEAQRLQAQLSRPFTNEGQFKSTNKTIDKLEESAARIQVIMDGLKFSDLKLTPDQQASFDQLNSKIDEIKANYLSLTESVKQGVMADAGNAGLINTLFPNASALTANFSDIKAAVDQHVADLIKAAEDERKAYEQMKSNAELASRANTLTTVGGGIQYQTVGKAIFDQFLYKNQYGMGFQKAFNNKNGTSQFLQALEQEFKLEPGALKDLIGKSFQEINQALQDYGKDPKNNPFKGIMSLYGGEGISRKMTQSLINIGDLESQISQYKRLQTELQNLQDTKVTPADTDAQSKIAGLKEQLSQLEQQIVKTANAGGSMQTPLNEFANQCDQLRRTVEQTNAQFLKMERTTRQLQQMKTAVVNFMGFNQVLRLTRQAVKEAMNHIKELDSVMNKISIVTDMSTGDLWNQVDAYSDMAQKYGVSIKGAYEVSQIYYQQGLETKDVMTLTNETLKLAKISGLDYATTTDYMTTALRGFKMEMSEASTVVDVYSNLAAHTAVSQEELAVAMSKTASSMEGVGATFEEASAMIATMVAVTRESATNIGSAMKSIASRYGELTKDPQKLIDSEGEEMAFNKVDAALQSVGISMKTADGQFREFTDVIIELGEQWENLDSVQQRYIATQFAGNRQQSRFLALVSNVDLLKSNLNYAQESEDVGTLQALKAMDSIESKMNQVQVAYQQFYTTMGVEDVWKGMLDGATNVIETLNNLPKAFGKIPVGAVAIVYDIISLVKSAALHGLGDLATIITSQVHNTLTELEGTSSQTQAAGQNFFDKFISGMTSRYGALKAAAVQGVQEAATAVRDHQIEEKMKQWDQNDESIKNNQAAIFGYQAALNAKGDSGSGLTDASAQEAALQALGVSAEEAKAKIAELQATNQDLSNSNKDLEASINAETNAENTNADAKGRNALLTKEGANAALVYAANHRQISSATNAFASGLNMIATMIGTTTTATRVASGAIMGFGGALRAAGALLEYFKSTSAVAFPWMAVIMGAISVINGLFTAIEDADERAERLSKTAENLNNKAKEEKANYSTLDKGIQKLEELETKRYESAEAAEEYQTAVDELAEKFPQLIAGFDEAGNVMISVQDSESVLAAAREKSAQATYDAAKAELEAARDKNTNAKQALKNDRDTFDSQMELLMPQIVPSSLNENKQRYNYMLNKVQGNVLLENQLKDMYQGWMDASDFEFFSQSNGIDVSDFSLDSDAVKESNKIITELQEAYAQYQNVTDLTSKEGREALTRLTKSLRAVSKIDLIDIDDNTFSLLEALQSSLGNVLDLSGIEEGLAKKTVSTWQQLDEETYNYLKESSGVAAIVTQAIVDTWQNAGSDKYELNNENIQIFSNISGARDKMEAFWNGLSDKQRELFNKMFEDPSNYSAIDFEKEFGKTRGWNDDVQTFIENYYTGVQSLRERLHKNLDERSQQDNTGNYINQFDKSFDEAIDNTTTEVEARYLESILDIEKNLEDKHYQNRGANFGAAALSLFDQVRGIGGEVEKNLWQIIYDSGLNTVEGIKKIQDYINNNDQIENKKELTDNLDTIAKTIIPNINLEIQTATFDLLETWEDTSKELSSAMTGGVSLKDADKLIQKAKTLGLKDFSLDNFELVGDKLVLGQDDFKDYYDALNASTKKSAEEWEKRIESAKSYGTLLQNTDITSLPSIVIEDLRATFESIGFDFSEYLTSDGRISIEGIEALQQAIQNSQEELTNYNRAAQIAADQLLNSENRRNGIYERHANEGQLDENTLRNIGKNLHIERDNIQDAAIKESLNKAYDSLISDVLSKGLKNINLADYEGLINNGEGIDLKNTTYTDFVRNYIDFAGKTVDEINDLMLQAMEKDRETTSSDLIKDLQFFDEDTVELDRSQLNELAKAFDRPLDTIINELGISFDELTGKALVSINDLLDKGIDLKSVEGYSSIIEDSIHALFESIVSAITGGIKGTLSSEDARSLQQFASHIGIEELHFIETADGLKLANNEAIKLYNTIKSIDALQGKIILKELMDSLKANNEHYASVTSILGYINELQQKINSADSSTPDSRLKEYQAELEVAKEILSVRSTEDEDASFSFMSKDIPGAQKNPINYIENWKNAFDTIAASSKSGYMDWQAFRNMITEMGNLADITGEAIPLGQDILVSSETAAGLIAKAATALKIDPTDGKYKLDMSALSQLGFDFKGGAEKLEDNVADGIKSLAKSQIEMLDGLIAMLEAIVAMQELNLDENSDNVIDVGEIFDFENDGKLKGKISDLLTFINTSVAEVTVGGQSLNEALLTRLNPQELSQFFTELNNIITDPDCDPSTIKDRIIQLIKSFFPKEEIQVNDAIFGMIGFDKETLGTDLYNQIIEYIKTGMSLSDANKNGLIKAIKEKNEELGTALENLFANNSGLSFSAALKIAAELTEEGEIVEEEDKTWSYTYDGEKHSGYTSKEAAEAALKAELLKKYQNYDDMYKVPEVSTIEIIGEGIIGYNTTLSDGEHRYTVNGANINWSGTAAQFEAAVKSGTISGNVTTITDPNTGEIIRIVKSGSISYAYQVSSTDGETTFTIGNNTYIAKNADESTKQELVDFFENNTDASNVVDITKLDEEGNEVPIKLARSFSGIIYEVTVGEDDSIHIGDKTYSSSMGIPAAVENYEKEMSAKSVAEGESEKETSKPVDKGPLIQRWAYNGTWYDITYNPTNDTYTINDGNPISGLGSGQWEAAVKQYLAGLDADAALKGQDNKKTYDYEGPLTWTALINGTNYEITQDENGQFSINGTPVTGKTVEEALAEYVGIEVGEIDAGTITRVVSVNTRYESIDSKYNDIRKAIMGVEPSGNISQQNLAEKTLDPFGLDKITAWHGKATFNLNGINELAKDAPNLKQYVNYLGDMVAHGQAFGDIDFNNLQKLQRFGLVDEDATQIDQILKDYSLLINNQPTDTTSPMIEALSNVSSGNIESIATALQAVAAAAELLQNIGWDTIIQGLNGISSSQQSKSKNNANPVTNVEVEISGQEKIDKIKETTSEGAELPITSTDENSSDILSQIFAAAAKTLATVPVTTENTDISATLIELQRYINDHPLHAKIETDGSGGATGTVQSKGILGLAKAQGTLMGELGPELVVSKGRYFVVGQNGPEMVDLDDDAIVFNHLQTKSLLEKGMSNGRGQAVTNERNAVSFATGNVHSGPAMAGASAALAALKQLRAMWQSLAGLSPQDLLGSGGGGGGGGNKGAAYIKELEKWYNWLQKIAQLEKDINYYEQERKTITSEFAPNSKAYYDSLQKSITALKEELAITKDLYESQKKYFDQRREEMNSAKNPFSALYTFDENGQLNYKEGKMEWFDELFGSDSLTGKPNHTLQEQYDALIAAGFGDYMKYDSEGKEIDLSKGDEGLKSAIQAFWDKINSDQEEMQSLHDSITEYETKMLELEQKQNEIMKELRDNQIDVEKKVYDTVVEIKQRAIDELQDTRDAIEKANNKLITGLTNALTKEQDMYNTAENQRDLDKLQAQLAILQRSGGSASEISSLEEQIAEKQKDMYFDARQQEIDALQEASDKQLEKLDAQIKLQTELLEYQKTYGLLWKDVYTIMQGSPEEIANYIKNNNSTYWNMSLADLKENLNDLVFKTGLWAEYRDGVVGTSDSILSYLKEQKEKKDQTTGDGKKDEGKKDEGKKDEGKKDDGKKDEGKKEGGGSGGSKSDYKLDADGNIIYKYQAIDDKQHKKFKQKKDGSWEYVGKENHTWEECKDKPQWSQCSKCKKKVKNTDLPAQDTTTTETPETTTQEETPKEQKPKYWTVNGWLNREQKISSPYGSEAAATAKLDVYRSYGWENPMVVPHYKAGGYDYTTGLAMLHGTSNKPEAVFNAEQTKILRNNILSNNPGSLVNLLKSYNDAYQGLSSNAYSSISNSSNNTSIGKAEINMNIDKLANSYDAKQAGRDIMNEILHIASKTSANNSLGR